MSGEVDAFGCGCIYGSAQQHGMVNVHDCLVCYQFDIPSSTAPCTLADACADAVALAMAESKAWPDAAAAARLSPDVALTNESAIALAVAFATALAVDDAWALPDPPAPAGEWWF